MKVFVSISSRNRQYLPVFTSSFLKDRDNIEYHFYDNNKNICQYIMGKLPKHFYYTHFISSYGVEPLEEGNKAIAQLRREIVDDFFASDCDFLFMKDDDILITDETIMQGVETFLWCREHPVLFEIGALTLHGTRSHHTMLATEKGVFSKLNFTGEANVLFSREALESTGNRFDPEEEKGFADNQFHGLKECGYQYYDKIYPNFSLQHLGFGVNSSVVYPERNKPFWNLEPYVCEYQYYNKKKPIEVEVFDLLKWCNFTNNYGPEETAKIFLEDLKCK